MQSRRNKSLLHEKGEGKFTSHMHAQKSAKVENVPPREGGREREKRRKTCSQMSHRKVEEKVVEEGEGFQPMPLDSHLQSHPHPHSRSHLHREKEIKKGSSYFYNTT
jgi:hypothetical protein